MKQITLRTIVRRIENRVLVTELGDDMLMMNIESGNYLQLNKAGKIIWKKIEKPVEVVMLVSYLSDLFKARQEDCYKETISFLHTMKEKNLLELVNISN